ncbi:YcgL domain-containing protein [Microbulbifer sp. 2201CG32-9]|uniref:YcgL domain-containing protein n=1 Tax=unclassified Microbulbifer TaxID=2619833 RepID=UPI00345BD8F2
MICDIYRSACESEMYLYVAKRDGMSRVPDQLLALFGQPRHVMTLLLTAEKPLARADAGKVLDEIAQRGFYLQMPPQADSAMSAIAVQNSKLQH